MTTTQLPDTASAVLDFARSRRRLADRAEAELLEAAAAWADLHSVDSIVEAATYSVRTFGDTAIPVAGPGAPLVAEFAVAEFAAGLRLPTEAGKRLIGEALELRHRLPRLWHRVLSGDLPVWRARRVAAETVFLDAEAAAFVERHIAGVAHKIRPAELDRLVAEAIARCMPEEAERRRLAAADGRHFDIDHHQVSFQGTSQVHGELDVADALDLESAIRQGAARLADLGSSDSLDVRRSVAAGELARRQLALDLESPDRGATSVAPRTDRKPRQAVLHLHLSAAAVQHPDDFHVGRVDNTHGIVSAEQIRAWCGNPDTQITVKPVIDLADCVPVGAYEVPDRLVTQVALRDLTCVFPWCSRPARGCDTDHVISDATGGETSSDNLAPLCRRHHRLKTFGGWTYTMLEPGSCLWTSPHGLQFLRDHQGTLDVSHDRR